MDDEWTPIVEVATRPDVVQAESKRERVTMDATLRDPGRHGQNLSDLT